MREAYHIWAYIRVSEVINHATSTLPPSGESEHYLAVRVNTTRCIVPPRVQ